MTSIDTAGKSRRDSADLYAAHDAAVAALADDSAAELRSLCDVFAAARALTGMADPHATARAAGVTSVAQAYRWLGRLSRGAPQPLPRASTARARRRQKRARAAKAPSRSSDDPEPRARFAHAIGGAR